VSAGERVERRSAAGHQYVCRVPGHREFRPRRATWRAAGGSNIFCFPVAGLPGPWWQHSPSPLIASPHEIFVLRGARTRVIKPQNTAPMNFVPVTKAGILKCLERGDSKERVFCNTHRGLLRRTVNPGILNNNLFPDERRVERPQPSLLLTFGFQLLDAHKHTHTHTHTHTHANFLYTQKHASHVLRCVCVCVCVV
jgi:hypothetical protein